jgi:hypothetical protein
VLVVGEGQVDGHGIGALGEQFPDALAPGRSAVQRQVDRLQDCAFAGAGVAEDGDQRFAGEV